MTDTPRVANGLSIGHQYDAFLYASIGVERNGNVLSLLSAMARMGIDPWQEAAQLSALSGSAAASRLSALLDAMPGAQRAEIRSATIVQKLIELLPAQHITATVVKPLNNILLIIGTRKQTRIALFVIAVLIAIVLAPLWSIVQHPTPNSQNTAHNALPK